MQRPTYDPKNVPNYDRNAFLNKSKIEGYFYL